MARLLKEFFHFKTLKFEYGITLAYLLLGGLWILFSDKILTLFTNDPQYLTELQTFKGWFYVIVTALLLFIFITKHLNRLRSIEKELENHKNHLQDLVREKTKDLDEAIIKLSKINNELQEKNELINKQNDDLYKALLELKETNAKLQQSDKMASIGILTAGIAHDINNPLNYILGGTVGLENYFEETGKMDDKTVFFLDTVKSGIDRVSSIVSGLNQMSRNKDTYEENCDIHNIINNCLLIINDQIKGKIELVKNFCPDKPIVLGNVGQLHQVFTNVLVNAAQAIAKNGKIFVATQIEKGYIKIEIEDTGCGIEAEKLTKVMDPFYTTKEPGVGTGLGLSITAGIVHKHKGNITIKSEVDKGTTVEISLPLKLE